MNFFTKQNIPPAGSNDIVFRISLWGPLISLLIFLAGLFVGVALFIYSYQSSVTWGMILSGIYSLIMGGICHILFRTLKATLSPANWLTRISSGGILLKYRSYLHDNSPKEDPIALHLSWHEIADAQLQEEIYTTTYIDEKRELRRWFLSIKLDASCISIDKIRAALEFENQRKPAHFRVDDLKHDLFMARKNKAADSEIARIKQEIALEKSRHPGRHNKTYFRDRPVTFINPDKLRMEWSHVTPGKKMLRQLLARHATVIGDQQQHFDIEKPMVETAFKSLLGTLLNRDEEMEAVKLVRLQLGYSISEAKAFIEKIRQQEKPAA